MSEQEVLEMAVVRSAWRSTVSVRLGAGNVSISWDTREYLMAYAQREYLMAYAHAGD
jgi:hypothetical protein